MCFFFPVYLTVENVRHAWQTYLSDMLLELNFSQSVVLFFLAQHHVYRSTNLVVKNMC